MEKEAAYQKLCQENNLKADIMQEILRKYETSKRLPDRNEVKALPDYKVKLFERKPLHERLMGKTREFIQKFYADI